MIKIEKEEKEPREHYRIEICGITRILPIRRMSPMVSIAVFNILGDWELTEAVGQELATKIPRDVEALVMPGGKAQALLHVMGRESKLPTVVARKEQKSYAIGSGVSVSSVRSITTSTLHEFYLSDEDVCVLRGKKVAIVDDVVSTGGTIVAMKWLMEKIDASVVAVIAACTEGDPKPEVIALRHIPLFK